MAKSPKPAMSFMDGSGFTSTGQAVAAPKTPNTVTTPVQNIVAAPLPSPQTQVNLNVPKSISTDVLSQNVTNFDLNKILAQNQQTRNSFIQQLNDTKELNAARQRSTDAYNTLRNFDISLEGGIQKIMNKPIALEFQQGQQSALTRDAAFTRSSLARGYEAAGLDLQNVQQARNELLQQYQYLMQFGQEDVNTAFKLDEIKRADDLLKYQQREAAKQFALDQQVTKPYYEVGGTIYRASDGKAYSTPEEFWADGGSKNFSDVQTGLKTPADRAFEFQQEQFKRGIFESDRNFGLQKEQFEWQKKTGKRQFGEIGTDEFGNPIKGFIDLEKGTVSAINYDAIDSKFADGSIGGQCGEFCKQLTTLPTPGGRTGNAWSEKKMFVDKYGIPGTEVKQGNVQPGDVLYFDLGTKYGHVATVIADNGDGSVTVKDSNWGEDEKIQTRTVYLSDPNIYGSIRGTLKQGLTSDTGQVAPQVQAYANQYASTGKPPEGMPKQIFSKVAAVAKDLPKDPGTIVDKNTNVRSSKLTDQQYEGLASLYDIVQNKLPNLQRYNQQIDKSLAGKVGSIFYKTQTRQDFLTTRQEILNLLVKARSGAAVTEAEFNRYKNMLPGDLALTDPGNNAIVSLAKSLNDTLQAQVNTRGVAIYGYTTVKVNGQNYKVGDIISNGEQQARVNADGSLTLIQ